MFSKYNRSDWTPTGNVLKFKNYKARRFPSQGQINWTRRSSGKESYNAQRTSHELHHSVTTYLRARESVVILKLMRLAPNLVKIYACVLSLQCPTEGQQSRVQHSTNVHSTMELERGWSRISAYTGFKQAGSFDWNRDQNWQSNQCWQATVFSTTFLCKNVKELENKNIKWYLLWSQQMKNFPVGNSIKK